MGFFDAIRRLLGWYSSPATSAVTPILTDRLDFRDGVSDGLGFHDGTSDACEFAEGG